MKPEDQKDKVKADRYSIGRDLQKYNPQGISESMEHFDLLMRARKKYYWPSMSLRSEHSEKTFVENSDHPSQNSLAIHIHLTRSYISSALTVQMPLCAWRGVVTCLFEHDSSSRTVYCRLWKMPARRGRSLCHFAQSFVPPSAFAALSIAGLMMLAVPFSWDFLLEDRSGAYSYLATLLLSVVAHRSVIDTYATKIQVCNGSLRSVTFSALCIMPVPTLPPNCNLSLVVVFGPWFSGAQHVRS